MSYTRGLEMRGENLLINVKETTTGTVSRITRKIAEPLVNSGKFVYISNSEYKKAVRPKTEPVVQTEVAVEEKAAKPNKVGKSKNSKQARKEAKN